MSNFSLEVTPPHTEVAFSIRIHTKKRCCKHALSKLLYSIVLVATGYTASAQVGIGTSSPDPSAQLDIVSSEKGILIPRVTLTNRPGSVGKVDPVEGLIIYQTDVDPGFYYFDGSNWEKLVKRSELPSTSFASRKPTPAQITSSNLATAVQFHTTSLSADLTSNGATNPDEFTVQKKGLYQINYNINLYTPGLTTAFSYIASSDVDLYDRLYDASLDQVVFSSAGSLKGQATLTLEALTSLRLVISTASSVEVRWASFTITRL
jgi:hypothetical protein